MILNSFAFASIGTAHCPWTYAIPEDAAYIDFVDNATSIYRNLPISKALAAFLLDILDPNPATRLTLNDMRRTVKTIDTFFPTDEELALAPQKIRDLVLPYVEGNGDALPAPRIPNVSTTWEEGIAQKMLAGPDHRLDKYHPRHGSSSRSSLWSDEMGDSSDEGDKVSRSMYSSSSSCYQPRRVVNPDSHQSGSDSSEPRLQREQRSVSPESEGGPRTPVPPPMNLAGPIQTQSSHETKVDGEDEEGEDESWVLDVTGGLEEMAHVVRAFSAVAISQSS